MLPVYELTVVHAKLSPRKDEGQVRAADSLPRVEGGSFVFYDATLPHFAEMFSQLRGVDLPVVDRTGIAGTYDLILKGAPDAAREGDGATLFRIVEDQLGLKLQPAKAAFDVIVIDHAEKPSGN